jgi:choline dehydrogenase-like flavoprotein
MVTGAVRETDVVIVGSGATGSLLAAHLGEAGHAVVVVEAGPARQLKQLYSSTVWSRLLKWHGPPVISKGRNPIVNSVESGWGTGGSALHHYAVWLRMHREDFKLKSLYGKGLDWPIEYDELRPYYDLAQREAGISGDAEREVWRPAGEKYPMPAQPVFRQAELIAAGFSALGKRVAPLPMAINSVAYLGRPACLQDGWCDAGCPTGALANPIVLFGERMARAGVDILTDAFVTHIDVNASGDRAVGVVYRDANRKAHRIRAKLVIVAAFAVQTPRLLLNSTSSRHPKGLGNANDLVGRYFLTHGAVSLYGMFKEETENYMGRTGGQLLSQESYRKDHHPDYVSGYSWRVGQALKLADFAGIANARPELIGADLARFMKSAPSHLATMNALADDPASANNRVTLSDQHDDNDMPLATVTHDLSEDALRCIADIANEGKRIFAAAGATESWAGQPHTEHMMGGTIMGKDARSSVTDSYGRLHELENVFVAGPGLFPSTGAVNPTFTASALAARTAEHIQREWFGLAHSH